LLRKELAVLFGSPLAWLTMAGIALVTALLFFDQSTGPFTRVSRCCSMQTGKSAIAARSNRC
jgi:hypothetical protein